ncbi:APO protein 4, mitochondrial [Ricinus communis]|uniref:APO protein 4, mitochondrial, putative n=1 Tax=Ricinus communis TaxID=3988 RepID=B9SMM2_RICCO|nr:APO protein 4, mitochondrial [Ricinus communis]EEF35167.1 APO protein 4, mitochondrial precursor, putative [Ricinus communis]|eukprot:XP_002527241.1 APO protein 4, mitochondrial [Ricinus communis]
MASRKKIWQDFARFYGNHITHFRFYSSQVDWKKLRPMILKRIENRAKDYPVRDLVPVAHEVLQARMLLIQGVSTLIQVIPVVACKFCPEVHIGERGHLIQTCWGYRRGAKNRVHEWIGGGLNDILVPVETFRLNSTFQKVIKHDQRFDFDRVPAIVELCRQAGAYVTDENLYYGLRSSDNVINGVDKAESLSAEDLQFVANGTLRAWETLRSGVQRLLLVYQAKVCKYCSEIHVGPSGHKARHCGIFKYESWRGSHFWERARVDDLVPPKIVWRRRPQDPPVLLNEGRNFYGHAPAIVDLCTKAGAIAPTKYYCMMKNQGLTAPV